MSKPLSYSEASTLAQCEQRWVYRYVKEIAEPPGGTGAMQFGKLMHTLCQAWWAGTDWRVVLIELSPDLNPDIVGKATWLMTRYEDWYEQKRNEYDVVEAEVEWFGTTPGGTIVHGFVDHLLRDKEDDTLWVLERKTMGRWDKLDLLNVDPQVTTYFWLAEQQGLEIAGVIYDAMLTYQWVKDRPVRDSFQWIYLDRTPEQITLWLQELDEIAKRRQILAHPKALPLHNIGPACKGCSFRLHCQDEMAFGFNPRFIEED